MKEHQIYIQRAKIFEVSFYFEYLEVEGRRVKFLYACKEHRNHKIEFVQDSKLTEINSSEQDYSIVFYVVLNTGEVKLRTSAKY